jgi:hypothetical protein
MRKNGLRDKDGVLVADTVSNEGLTWKDRDVIEKDASTFRSVDLEKRIFVRSNYAPDADGGNAVALFEKHVAHPSGEAYVTGSTPVEVALTEKVCEALQNGEILPCSEQEISLFEAEQSERVQRAVEAVAAKKNLYREKFVAVFGTDAGFEQAFEGVLKQQGLSEIMRELRS